MQPVACQSRLCGETDKKRDRPTVAPTRIPRVAAGRGAVENPIAIGPLQLAFDMLRTSRPYDCDAGAPGWAAPGSGDCACDA
jgi:hypothetical protein